MSEPGKTLDPAKGYARVAEAVVGDVGRVGKSGADALLPGGGPGAERTTQAAFVQHLRNAWPYEEKRQEIFARMVPTTKGPDGQLYPARNGLQYWENLVRAAFPFGFPVVVPSVAPPVLPPAAPPPAPLPPLPPDLGAPPAVGPQPVQTFTNPGVPTPPPLSGPQVPY